jgi:hypothetical protein
LAVDLVGMLQTVLLAVLVVLVAADLAQVLVAQELRVKDLQVEMQQAGLLAQVAVVLVRLG